MYDILKFISYFFFVLYILNSAITARVIICPINCRIIAVHRLVAHLIARRRPHSRIDTRSEQMSMNVNANISNECDWIKYVNPLAMAYKLVGGVVFCGI